MKFQIFKGKNKKYYFNLKARNGQVILSSQGYADTRACKNGIKSVKDNSTSDENYDLKTAKNGKHYFTLLAKNKQIVGSSQMYSSQSSMKRGIAAVQRVATNATIEELT